MTKKVDMGISLGADYSQFVAGLKKSSQETERFRADMKNKTAAIEKDTASLGKALEGMGDSISETFSQMSGSDISGVLGQLSEVRGAFSAIGAEGASLAAVGGAFTAIAAAVAAATAALVTFGAEQRKTAMEAAKVGLTRTTYGQVGDITGALGGDVASYAKASRAIGKAFQLDNEKAVALLREAAIKGLDLNELDWVEEYGRFFAQAGYSVDEFLAKVIQLKAAGDYQDYSLDALKEFTIRFQDMQKAQRDALSGIGLDWQKLRTDYANGSITMRDAMTQVVSAMQATGASSQATYEVLTNLFGAKGEDVGLEMLGILGQMDGGLKNISDQADQYTQRILAAKEEMTALSVAAFDVAEIGGSIEAAFYEVGASILQAVTTSRDWQATMEVISTVWGTIGETVRIVGDVLAVAATTIRIINDSGRILYELFGGSKEESKEILSIWEVIMRVLNDALRVLRTMVAFAATIGESLSFGLGKIFGSENGAYDDLVKQQRDRIKGIWRESPSGSGVGPSGQEDATRFANIYATKYKGISDAVAAVADKKLKAQLQADLERSSKAYGEAMTAGAEKFDALSEKAMQMLDDVYNTLSIARRIGVNDKPSKQPKQPKGKETAAVVKLPVDAKEVDRIGDNLPGLIAPKKMPAVAYTAMTKEQRKAYLEIMKAREEMENAVIGFFEDVAGEVKGSFGNALQQAIGWVRKASSFVGQLQNILALSNQAQGGIVGIGGNVTVPAGTSAVAPVAAGIQQAMTQGAATAAAGIQQGFASGTSIMGQGLGGIFGALSSPMGIAGMGLAGVAFSILSSYMDDRRQKREFERLLASQRKFASGGLVMPSAGGSLVPGVGIVAEAGRPEWVQPLDSAHKAVANILKQTGLFDTRISAKTSMGYREMQTRFDYENSLRNVGRR